MVGGEGDEAAAAGDQRHRVVARNLAEQDEEDGASELEEGAQSRRRRPTSEKRRRAERGGALPADGDSEDGERRDLRGERGDRGADAVAEAAHEEKSRPRLRTPPKATESSGVVASGAHAACSTQAARKAGAESSRMFR